MRLAILARAAAGVWLAAAPVRADPSATVADRADRLLHEAIALREAGDAQAACVRFEASVRLRPEAKALIALGECRERAGDLSEAMWLYREASSVAADAGDRERVAMAKDRASRIARTAARLTLDTSAFESGAWVSLTIDDRAIGRPSADRDVYLPAGRHRVRAVRPGCARWQGSFTAKPGEHVELRVSSLRCSGGARARGAARIERPAPREPRPRRHPGLFRFGGWTTAAGGIVVGVGFGFRQRAGSSWNNAEAYGCDRDGNCPFGDGRALVDEARAAEHRMWTAFLLGGATMAAGVTCMIVGGRRRDRATPRVAVVPATDGGRGALVTVGGVF